jgi:hypothetical protein
MRERAQLAGGTLTVESAPGKGTTIVLRLRVPPVTPPSPVPGEPLQRDSDTAHESAEARVS